MLSSLPHRLLLVGMLYLSQFVANGFLYFGIGGVLREQGVELEQLAAFTALGLVWAAKALWAPLLDRFGARGRQFRAWLLVLQPLMALSFLAFAPVPPDAAQLGLILWLAAVLVVVSGTQDIAADALVVRMMAERERPQANGVQLAASYVGNVVGGGLFLVVYDAGGWVPAVLAVTAVALIPVPFVWTLREPVRGERPKLGASFAALASVLRLPGALLWTAVTMPLVYSGFAAGSALFLPAFVDQGWSLTEVGVLQSATSAIAGPIGGLAAGWAMGRVGRRPVLAVSAALGTASVLGLAACASGMGGAALAVAAVSLLMAASASISTIIFTRNMDFARPATPGTDFTMLTAIWMLVLTLESSAALWAAGAFGYGPVLVVGAAMGVLGAVLLWRRAGGDVGAPQLAGPAPVSEPAPAPLALR